MGIEEKTFHTKPADVLIWVGDRLVMPDGKVWQLTRAETGLHWIEIKVGALTDRGVLPPAPSPGLEQARFSGESS